MPRFRTKADKRQRTGSVDPSSAPTGACITAVVSASRTSTLHRVTTEEPFCNVEADARKYTGDHSGRGGRAQSDPRG
jgi:hypothetical protein